MNKLNYEWPTDRNEWNTFKPDYNFSVYDRHKQQLHYEKLLRREFRGLRPKVVQHECTMLTAWVREEKEVVPKEFPRWFVFVELDAHHKEDDPVLSWWQRVILWVQRRPCPKAPEPPRIQKYYSMSPVQFGIFKNLFVKEFTDET